MQLDGKGHLIRSPPERFIVRPRPYIDESWPGYLLRFAKVNGLRGILPIANVLGVRAFDLIVGDPQQILKQLSVVGFDDSADSVPLNTRAHRVSRRLLARVCPGCLLTDRYISIYWDYPAYATCPKHHCLLTDTCPACSQPLTYSRPGFDRCRCGFDLKSAPMPSIPLWWDKFERIFNLSRLSVVPDSEAAISDNLAQARPLFRMLCWLKTQHDVRRSQTVPRVVSTDMEAIGKLLEEWPRGFLNVVKAISDGLIPVQVRTFKRSLSRIGSVEIDAALSQLAQVGKSPRVAKLPLSGEVTELSIGSIRRLTKLNFYAARKLVQSPLFKGVRAVVDPRRQKVKYQIPFREGLLLRQFIYETFSINEIATQLKCSPQHVRSFVHMHMLMGLRLTKSGSNYRFRIDDVDALMSSLMSRVIAEPSSTMSLVSLSNVPAYYKRSSLSPQWRDLMRGILNGTIKVYAIGSKSQGLSALAVRKEDLPRIRHRVSRRVAANMR